MVDLEKLQKEIYQNKIDKGFNVKDVNLELDLVRGELDETQEAYRENKSELGEELADMTIYLLGIAEILEIDLGKEIVKKVAKNKNRRYKKVGQKYIKVVE